MTNRELLIFLSNQGYFDLETHFIKHSMEIPHKFYFQIDEEDNITDILYFVKDWISITNGLSAKEWFDKMEAMRKDIEEND